MGNIPILRPPRVFRRWSPNIAGEKLQKKNWGESNPELPRDNQALYHYRDLYAV